LRPDNLLTPALDSFYSEGMHVGLPAIRLFYLLLLCISSALTFLILTNIIKLKKIYAIPASITPNIMPAYSAIPVGLNASYAVWAYIPIMTAFLLLDGLSVNYQKFNSKRKKIFVVSYLFLIFIAHNISIGFLFAPVVILFPILYLKKIGKPATSFLIFFSAFFSIFQAVTLLITGYRESSISNHEVLKVSAVKFINTVIPLQGWALLDRNTEAIAIILIIITGFALLAYSKKIYKPEVTLFHRVIVVIFLGLFVLGNTIPYIIQDPEYIRPEWHPYLANFGYQVLLFVFFGTLIYYAFRKISSSSKLLVYSFSIIVLFYGTVRLLHTQKYFAPYRAQSAAIRNQLLEKEIPLKAQLVILYTEHTEYLKGPGILSWNSGYISYLLGRNDLSAIMGPEYTDHNIFKEVDPYEENMTNLEKNRPVLIFEYDPKKQTLRSKDYLVTFYENNNKIYTLYSLHNKGELSSLFSGIKEALEDYLESKSIPPKSIAFY
jgi:hypothetical protein